MYLLAVPRYREHGVPGSIPTTCCVTTRVWRKKSGCICAPCGGPAPRSSDLQGNSKTRMHRNS
eukprot:354671-Rhodomonas_salina.2